MGMMAMKAYMDIRNDLVVILSEGRYMRYCYVYVWYTIFIGNYYIFYNFPFVDIVYFYSF